VSEAGAEVRRAELLEARERPCRDALDVVNARVVGKPAELTHDRLSRGCGVVTPTIEKLGELEKLDFVALREARSRRPRSGRGELAVLGGADETLAHLRRAEPTRMGVTALVT
jgi:hypothetical protein